MSPPASTGLFSTSPVSQGGGAANVSSSLAGVHVPRKRLRTSRACINCCNLKIRCRLGEAGFKQACERCKEFGLECRVPPARQKKQPRTSQPDSEGGSGRSLSPSASRDRNPNPGSRGVADSRREEESIPNSDAAQVQGNDWLLEYDESRSHSPLNDPPATRTVNLSDRSDTRTGRRPRVRSFQTPGLPKTSGLRQLLEDRVDGGHFARPDPRFLGATSLASVLTPVAEDPDHSPLVFRHDILYGLRRVDVATQGDTAIWAVNGPKPLWRLPTHRLERPVIEKLMSHYLEHMLPLLPIFTAREVQDLNSLTAFQILAVCASASLSRTVPRPICVSLRSRLYHLLETAPGGNIWTSSRANLSALLIMSMSADLHGSTASGAGSVNLLRSGVLVRMAMDLGLHRSVTQSGIGASKSHHRGTARLWSLINMSDAWFALTYGQPMLIDHGAVDALPVEPGDTVEERFLYQNDQLHRLLRRILRAMYNVSKGLFASIDSAVITNIVYDLRGWHHNLPSDFKLQPPTSPGGEWEAQRLEAGFLAVVSCTTEFILVWPFRFTKSLSTQTLAPYTENDWLDLVERSRAALTWLLDKGHVIVDCWVIGLHSIAYLCQLHYRHYCSTHDHRSLQLLETTMDELTNLASTHPDLLEPTSILQRLRHMIEIFHTAAMGSNAPTMSGHDSLPGGIDPMFDMNPAYMHSSDSVDLGDTTWTSNSIPMPSGSFAFGDDSGLGAGAQETFTQYDNWETILRYLTTDSGLFQPAL